MIGKPAIRLSLRLARRPSLSATVARVRAAWTRTLTAIIPSIATIVVAAMPSDMSALAFCASPCIWFISNVISSVGIAPSSNAAASVTTGLCVTVAVARPNTRPIEKSRTPSLTAEFVAITVSPPVPRKLRHAFYCVHIFS